MDRALSAPPLQPVLEAKQRDRGGQEPGDAAIERSRRERDPVERGRAFGEAEDMEAILLTMVSSAGRYMTGSIVTVDGGLSVASV